MRRSVKVLGGCRFVERDRVLLMPQGTLVEELDQRAKWDSSVVSEA